MTQVKKIRRYTLRAKITLAFVSCLACLGGLLLFEAAVRYFFPYVNVQGMQESLLREKAYGDTFGFEPDTSGIVFGMDVSIDEQGLREMAVPQDAARSWLLLGDSVAFGVGVDTENTFAGMLQEKYPSVRILNTSVPGYSTAHYEDVLKHFLKLYPDTERVLLFYVLNDVFPNTIRARSFHRFLKCYSKSYQLVKGLLFDRSRANFFNAARYYDAANEDFARSIRAIKEMNALLKQRQIDFTVVILPYEYQLRMRDGDLFQPQDLLREELRADGISCIDTAEAFLALNEDSRKFFLYVDPMHFSVEGHRVVFDLLTKELGDP